MNDATEFALTDYGDSAWPVCPPGHYVEREVVWVVYLDGTRRPMCGVNVVRGVES